LQTDVSGLSKAFAGRQIFSEVTFSVQPGELVSIIGPSGVGKTTLLKIIAGLETADQGIIHYSETPSKANPVILVFQDFLLFPTMTVAENIAFGLRARKTPEQDVTKEVNRFLEYFGIQHRAEAYPAKLSGGEKQRVAIARALILRPAILLLDEPFANLDQNLKMGTARFLRDLQKEWALTIICVTHDLQEAFFMSDKIGLLLDGQLKQFGTPREVYQTPATTEVGEFMGPVNILKGASAENLGAAEGEVIRAEQLRLKADQKGQGQIHDIHFLGNTVEYCVSWEGEILKVHSMETSFSVGYRVALSIRK
jgi:putative spermidine/putrescine transport system ATP-binding protein